MGLDQTDGTNDPQKLQCAAVKPDIFGMIVLIHAHVAVVHGSLSRTYGPKID